MAAGDGTPRRFDGRLRSSLWAVSSTGAGLALAGAALAGLGAGVSVGAGAMLAAGNLWALARIVLALLPDQRAGADAQSRAGWGLVAALKIAALLVVAWLLLDRGIVSPLPMLVGFASLPIGIAIGTLVSDRSAPSEDY